MNVLDSTQLLLALAPVFVLIGLGWFSARMAWMKLASIADLSKVVFYLFMPALL